MSEETGKGEGPAAVIFDSESMICDVQIGNVSVVAHDCRWNGNMAKGYAEDLNKALSPLTRKAALCERMAEAIRRYKGCRYDEDPGPYIAGLDDLLEEFDREAKK